MKILYFGSACGENWFKELIESQGQAYMIAQYMFEMALIEGISENKENIELSGRYIHLGFRYPKNKKILFKSKSNEINYKYKTISLAFINLPIIKEISIIITSFLSTFKWCYINRKDSDKKIITSLTYTPVAIGVIMASKLFKVKRIGIITDLSSYTYSDERIKLMNFGKRIVIKPYLNIVKNMEQSYDGYILFTEEMNNIVNLDNKPYIVLEGIFNDKDLNYKKEKKENAIMYAGTLFKSMGIKMLLDAFELIEDQNLKLWIFGSGDMEDYIKELELKDKRINFFGFRSRDEIFKYEKKAKVLINVRNPKDEYTKYSFPSKTFEYMASGTPFITTKLQGIPKEYYEYIYTIENYSIESIENKIEKIINTSQYELDKFGEKAQNFILKNKIPVMQSNKVIKFLKELY